MFTIPTIVSQIRSEDWFVTVDLNYAYFLVFIIPSHRKFLRFTFRGEAFQYRVLPFGLALSPRTFTKCMDTALAPLRLQGTRVLKYIYDWLTLAQSRKMAVRHRDVILGHIQSSGLMKKSRSVVARPENHVPGGGMGLYNDAGTIVSCSYRVHLGDGPRYHCKALPKIAEAHSSCVQRNTFWPSVHETPTVVVETQGVSLRGNPFRMIMVMRRCLRALSIWKRPWFLSQGPVLGTLFGKKFVSTDSYGLGRSHIGSLMTSSATSRLRLNFHHIKVEFKKSEVTPLVCVCVSH